MRQMDLRGKKAIVTGGAMGYGFALCQRLLEARVDVAIWDLAEEPLQDAKRRLASAGQGRVFAYRCDVSDRARVEELARQVRCDMGQVDILVNNAAFYRKGDFLESPTADKRRQMEVNVEALFHTTDVFLPEMLERGSGAIVNISSGAAFVSFPGAVVYTASKWAVHGLT